MLAQTSTQFRKYFTSVWITNIWYCFFCLFPDILNCRGLTLDWLSRNLYWLSSENDESQINVARLDGSLKTSVIHGIDKPRCLVVHPTKGWVDYTTSSLYLFTLSQALANGSYKAMFHFIETEIFLRGMKMYFTCLVISREAFSLSASISH